MSTSSVVTLQRGQFWVFQLVGWSVWVLILVLLNLIFVPPALEYIFPLALVYSASAVVAIALTTGLRYIYRLVWERGLPIRFVIAWFASFLAAIIWQPFRNFVALLPFGEFLDFRNASREDLWAGLFSASFPLLLLWSGLYFIIKYYQLLQIEKEKGLRSEALANQAQLLMLRYQLNPHFLFNTLNAISTLVLARATDQANEMLTKLSKFLRYSLDHSPFGRVSLAHELEASRLYLDIEKVRFADRLRLKFDIDEAAETGLVPSMLLQPIIENSIKHGISKSESGGAIAITANRQDQELLIEVTDDGPGLSEAELKDVKFSFSNGVGVSNIRNRLREMYGDNHQLRFINVQPHGLTVRVIIPYDTE